MQGKTETEGRQMATMQAKGKVTVQATFVSYKGDCRVDRMGVFRNCNFNTNS